MNPCVLYRFLMYKISIYLTFLSQYFAIKVDYYISKPSQRSMQEGTVNHLFNSKASVNYRQNFVCLRFHSQFDYKSYAYQITKNKKACNLRF